MPFNGLAVGGNDILYYLELWLELIETGCHVIAKLSNRGARLGELSQRANDFAPGRLWRERKGERGYGRLLSWVGLCAGG